MKLSTSPKCDLCSTGCIGTYMHRFWDCPEVNEFWRRVTTTLKDILELEISCGLRLLLLSNDSSYTLSLTQKKLFFCGLTAAKKMLALRWKPPHSLAWTHWMHSFLDIANMELSVARLHGASKRTISAWLHAISKIKEHL